MRVTSRRRFLSHMTLAGAALAGRSLLSAPGERNRKMTLDLNCGSIGVRASLREAIDLAHRHGFESVGAPSGEIAAMDATQIDEVLGEMQRRKLVFGAAGLPVNFRGDDARFREGLRGLEDVARALERAGVTRMGTWITPGDRTLTYLRNFSRHKDRLREVAAVLGDHGIRLGLEYVGPKTSWSRFRFPFVHTLSETKELISAIGRGNVGVVLDSWHWYTAGETEDDLLSLTGEEIVAVDLNDAPEGKEIDEQVDSSRELPCATGVIDVAVFLNALLRMGYDGPVRAEPFNAELRSLPREEAVATTARAMERAFEKIR